MKLYGHPISTCTRKVLCTLNETNTPFELVTLDFAKADHKHAAHLARQPFGKMPALDDDGFVLYESRAMSRYIDAKAGHKLTPSDAKLDALMEQWISVEVENFTPNAMKFVYHTVFQRAQTDEVLAKAAEGLEASCSVLDKALAGKTYLVGDQFTIADICYAPYFEYAIMNPQAKEIFTKHANVASWWGRVSERPAWRKTAGRA
ncbi:MAG: glutathione S-transferase family protein [Deltaproteobacteria bacterium]|nr:glutathione S-transferase family protein [Deltaproteobacteria bacterium]